MKTTGAPGLGDRMARAMRDVVAKQRRERIRNGQARSVIHELSLRRQDDEPTPPQAA